MVVDCMGIILDVWERLVDEVGMVIIDEKGWVWVIIMVNILGKGF